MRVQIIKAEACVDNIHMKKYLMYITADGKVSEDELDDLQEMTTYLEDIVKTINELKIITEIAVKRSKKQCL